jgi:toxin CcdB
VQSDHLHLLPSRLVVPLLPPTTALPPIRDLTPLLVVGSETLARMTHFLAAVPRRELGKPVGNLLSDYDAIVRALDILLTGF